MSTSSVELSSVNGLKMSTNPVPSIDISDIEILYNKIHEGVDVKNVTASDIGIIIQKVVQILTKNSELVGAEKLKLVEYVITRLYEEIPESNNQKVAIFQAFIGAGLPTIIQKAYDWVMEKFDLDKDGKISCQECDSVWARCCPTATRSLSDLKLNTETANMER